MRAPAGYTDIYANWNVNVDNADAATGDLDDRQR